MTCGTDEATWSCTWCGGRGWKLVTLRRVAASGGDDERGLMRRRRAACIGCAGTGLALAAGEAS